MFFGEQFGSVFGGAAPDSYTVTLPDETMLMIPSGRLKSGRIATVYVDSVPYSFQLVSGVPVQVSTPRRVKAFFGN
jgi:hypothetical protein